MCQQCAYLGESVPVFRARKHIEDGVNEALEGHDWCFVCESNTTKRAKARS